MRKRKESAFLALFLAAGLCLSQTGCGTSEDASDTQDVSDVSEETDTQETDARDTAQPEEASEDFWYAPQVTIQTETYDQYDQESGSWLLHADYDTVAVSSEEHEALAEAVGQWSEQNVQTITALAEEYAGYAAEDIQYTQYTDTSSYYYAIYDVLEVTRADQAVLSLMALNSDYTGGAHGNYGYAGYTFDSESGALLSLSDILTDEEGFQEMAAEYIVQDLKENAMYTEGLFEGYEDTVASMWEQDTEPSWYLDAAGITFVFDPYLVGPYAMGAAFSTIPYAEAAPYMEDRYLDRSGAGVWQLSEGEAAAVTFGGTDMTLTVSVDRPDGEPYGEGTLRVQLGDSAEEAGTFAQVGKAYLMTKEDGKSYVLVDADYASDDYVTVVYAISDDGTLTESDRLEDVSLEYSQVNTMDLRLRAKVDVLGTYSAWMSYAIDGDGTLVQLSDTFEIMDSDYDWRLLTLVRELPVETDGGDATLPAGSRIHITGTDNIGSAFYQDEDTGETGTIRFTRGEDDYTIYIDGVPDTDYFESVPYAG